MRHNEGKRATTGSNQKTQEFVRGEEKEACSDGNTINRGRD